jgi:hypothetical protein
MTVVVNAFIAAVGVLPVMEFQFGQVPKYFQTQEFFVMASQLIIQILTGISSGLIGAIFSALFGVDTGTP